MICFEYRICLVISYVMFQLFDTTSSTYTYLLADVDSKEALLIDPVIEHAERDFQLVNDLNLTLKYASKLDEFINSMSFIPLF